MDSTICCRCLLFLKMPAPILLLLQDSLPSSWSRWEHLLVVFMVIGLIILRTQILTKYRKASNYSSPTVSNTLLLLLLQKLFEPCQPLRPSAKDSSPIANIFCRGIYMA